MNSKSNNATEPTMVVKFPNCTSFFSDKVLYGYRIYVGNHYREASREQAMEWIRDHGLVVSREGYGGKYMDPDDGTVWDSPDKSYYNAYNRRMYTGQFFRSRGSHAVKADACSRKRYYAFFPKGRDGAGFVFNTGSSRSEDAVIIRDYVRFCEEAGGSAEFGRMSRLEAQGLCSSNRKFNRHHSRDEHRLPVEVQPFVPLQNILLLNGVAL